MLSFAILILAPALIFAAVQPAALDTILQGLLDANKDGRVDKQEAEKYFLSYDSNKDGEISKVEFVSAVDKIDPQIIGHEGILFGLFDRNGDGHVNIVDIDAVFKLADLNRDNFIEKSELHLIASLASSHVGK